MNFSQNLKKKDCKRFSNCGTRWKRHYSIISLTLHTHRGRARGKKNNPKTNKQKTKTNKQIRKEMKAKKQLKSTVIRVGSVVAASKVKKRF
jgi:hypothetical protein